MDKYLEKAEEISSHSCERCGIDHSRMNLIAAALRECAAEAEDRARKAEAALNERPAICAFCSWEGPASTTLEQIKAHSAVCEFHPLRSQVESLTEKIAVLSTAIEQMICPSPRVLHSDAIGRKALTSTAPILDRIKNEAKAEAFEEAAAMCLTFPSVPSRRTYSRIAARAAALREASK